MGKKAPSAPDPAATAQAQALANKEAVYESARVNQIGEQSPYGRTYYTGDIGAPNRTKITELSPSQQEQLNRQNQLQSILGSKAVETAGRAFDQPFSYQGMTDVPTDYQAARRGAEDRVYNAITRNMGRDLDRSEESLRARLANQGLSQGSEAFNREMETFNNSKNNAFSNANLQAYQSGVAEENNAYNRANTDRQRQINEALMLRNQPINELSAILQGTPAIQNPTYTGGGANYDIQSPDVMSAINNNYNAQMQQQQQRASKFGDIVGTGLSAYTAFSDSRLKDNIVPLGTQNGYNVYEFSYKGRPERYVGVMAEEVLEQNPVAVTRDSSGYLMVDYDCIKVDFRRVA